MEKFITRIITRTLIMVLVGFICLASACQQNHTEKKIENYFPQEVIAKSLEFAINDKFTSRHIHSKKIYIQKNSLIDNIQDFKINDFRISMIDSAKVVEALSKSTVIEFLQFNILSGGTIELTYVLKSGYFVKLFFEKKKGQWVLTKSEPYQI